MKQILCSDWLHEGQDGPMLPAGDFGFGPQEKVPSLFGLAINPPLRKLVRSR